MHPADARLERPQRVLDGAAGRRRQAAFTHQRLRVARSQFADHLLAAVHRQPVGEHEELLRAQRRGDVLGDVFPCQVEHLAGRRIADVGDQHHFAGVERAADRERIDLSHRAGELEVDAFSDPDRAGGDEVAGIDADLRARHRRVGQALRQHCLDLDAQ